MREPRALADHHPPRAQPDPHAVPAPRVLRRALAARAAAHLRRTWPRTSSWPTASRPRCCWCWRRCTPTERAVFVLREVFDCRTTRSRPRSTRRPAVRQIAHRARSHVDARRPRQQVLQGGQTAVIERFLAAASTGTSRACSTCSSPDVVLITDGGGQKQAALRPIRAVEKVLRLLAAVRPDGTQADLVEINGGPAVRVLLDGELDSAGTCGSRTARHRHLLGAQPAEAGPAGRGGSDPVTRRLTSNDGEARDGVLRVRTVRRPSEPDPVSTGEGSHRAATPCGQSCCPYFSRSACSPPAPSWAPMTQRSSDGPATGGGRHRHAGHPPVLPPAEEAGAGVRGGVRLPARGARGGRRRHPHHQAGADGRQPHR